MPEELVSKLKDENDAFRIVFVCATLLTELNVRSSLKIFLDQPVFDEKVELTYQHIYDVYADPLNTRYQQTAV